MKILILTIGSRGDVQPYVALGMRLQQHQHDVTIGTCAEFESFISDHGLNYAFINNEQLEFMRSDDGRIAMEHTGNLWEAIQTGRRLLPKVGPMLRRQIDDAWKATQEVQPDLILFHPKALGSADFAERLQIPCMFAFYLPIYVPTGDFPAMGFPGLPLGRWYNRMTVKLINRVTWLATRKHINAWRVANGMARRSGRDFLKRGDGEVIPAIHAFSPSVIPQPDDWPETATVTGYWFLDRAADWQPSAELESFLSAGSPPVYFGFGSIFGRDPSRVTRMIVEAVRAAGVRAIVARGWGGLDPSGMELPDSMLAIDAAPHDWLFERCAAVVHHGGCGTTAAALRSGRPQFICSFFGDQPFWGKTMQSLGVAPAPIPQRRLTPGKLIAAIRQITTDAAMTARAVQLGQQIRSEDGVGNAVRFIER
ncbi:MAG: glycosyltransferase [Planctomycetaceae bacterium]